MFKVNNKDTRTTPYGSSVSFVNFEQVNAGWVCVNKSSLHLYFNSKQIASHITIFLSIHIAED